MFKKKEKEKRKKVLSGTPNYLTFKNFVNFDNI